MTVLQKIISGGQTGADRAALDFAIEHGIPHGGWCPAGRKAEDGTIDVRYHMVETPSSNYLQRTEWNVRDSDGTAVFSIEPALTGGSKKTVTLAHKHKKPVLHLPRDGSSATPEQDLLRFIREHGIKVLNVAGPRASKEPEIAAFVKAVLSRTIAIKGPGGRTVKVLFSDDEKLIIDFIRRTVGEVTRAAVTVITPPSSRVRDLLTCAAAQKWDLVILFANNIRYASGDRSPESLERDAARLVGEIVRNFKVPVVVLYAWPDLPTFKPRLLEAGAAAVFRTPPQIGEWQKAIERCLPVGEQDDAA